jgi:hypothetical protein
MTVKEVNASSATKAREPLSRTAHRYHLGCLALANYGSPANRKCPACTTPLLLPTYQKFIDSPSTVFIYACKGGLTNIASDVVDAHSLDRYAIERGFACATYGKHKDAIQMLFDRYYKANGTGVTCLLIAIECGVKQQQQQRVTGLIKKLKLRPSLYLYDD